MMCRITDNKSIPLSAFSKIVEKKDNPSFKISDSPLLEKIKDKPLRKLANGQDNIFVFPKEPLKENGLVDQKGKTESIVNSCRITENKGTEEKGVSGLHFGNVVGFIGLGDERLDIHSRFDNNDNDFFFQYMLGKVFHINQVNLPALLSDKPVLELLPYLFPHCLAAALKKGRLRQYKTHLHNDSCNKGPISIAQFIERDIPFTGKIAYSTRDLTFDNNFLLLIKHTIEYIKTLSYVKESGILTSVQKIIDTVERLTAQTYKRSQRREVIRLNKRFPIRSAYYWEHRRLQKLCIALLEHRSYALNGNSQQTYGIIFDASWLWEEYLNTVFEDDLPNEFIHSDNRLELRGVPRYSYSLDGHGQKSANGAPSTVYPDFYTKDHKLIVDAKYKKYKKDPNTDLDQLIRYAYILRATASGVVYPCPSDIEETNRRGKLAGYGAIIYSEPFRIPTKETDWSQFQNTIADSENRFRRDIERLHEDPDYMSE